MVVGRDTLVSGFSEGMGDLEETQGARCSMSLTCY